jgi:hypothetical protein
MLPSFLSCLWLKPADSDLADAWIGLQQNHLSHCL